MFLVTLTHADIQKALNTPYPAQYFAFDYDKMAGSGALKILGNTYRFEARTEVMR